ncbi:16916_t:CDS:2, partial [Funneliformis caledonium]
TQSITLSPPLQETLDTISTSTSPSQPTKIDLFNNNSSLLSPTMKETSSTVLPVNSSKASLARSSTTAVSKSREDIPSSSKFIIYTASSKTPTTATMAVSKSIEVVPYSSSSKVITSQATADKLDQRSLSKLLQICQKMNLTLNELTKNQ